MDNQKFIDICMDKLVEKGVDRDKIFVVWSCKTLQNNKAIMSYSDAISYAPLYEFTHNGDKKEVYMDVYEKQKNIKFSV